MIRFNQTLSEKESSEEKTRVLGGREAEASSPELPQILVVDDDPLFRAKVRQQAKKLGLSVTVCSSLREMQVMCETTQFDIAVVDYYLDDLKTYLRGTDVAAILESTPVLLISNTDHGLEDNNPFPQSVRKFVNKKIGIKSILEAAVHIATTSKKPDQ